MKATNFERTFFFRLVRQHQNQIYPLDCMRTSRNLKGQPGKLKERQGAPTGYNYYILQLRRVGLRLYRSSFPELSLPEGAGGAEAAARRNSARLKIKDWVQYYFVQKPSKFMCLKTTWRQHKIHTTIYIKYI